MTDFDPVHSPDDVQQHLREIQSLISRQKRVDGLVHRQEMPRHELVEGLVHKQHSVELEGKLHSLTAKIIARVLEALPLDDRLLVWNVVKNEHGEQILTELAGDIRESLLQTAPLTRRKVMLNAFELGAGRLRQIAVESRDDLASATPIWVDLVAPDEEEMGWVRDIFGLDLPDPADHTDLEASARFYVEEDGAIFLHSDFLLDKEDESRNVAVTFVLHRNILFSVRREELPVFRLQRLRARTQVGYVSDCKDVLLDLYAADVEYSADALEDIYAALEAVGSQVLSKEMTDADAAKVLAAIAGEEDLNGRIRRNVLDTRRAVSFLIRGRFLSASQFDDSQQLLRDIESLDGHTTFLFGKINFLMDATVAFININQNKRVSKLTSLSVIFMPINILAGIGGMSEFSMMTKGSFDIDWPIAYGGFLVASVIIGWATYHLLKFFETREARRILKLKGLAKPA
jgi:magnesium transporter